MIVSLNIKTNDLGGEIFSLIGLILAWPAIIADTDTVAGSSVSSSCVETLRESGV